MENEEIRGEKVENIDITDDVAKVRIEDEENSNSEKRTIFGSWWFKAVLAVVILSSIFIGYEAFREREIEIPRDENSLLDSLGFTRQPLPDNYIEGHFESVTSNKVVVKVGKSKKTYKAKENIRKIVESLPIAPGDRILLILGEAGVDKGVATGIEKIISD